MDLKNSEALPCQTLVHRTPHESDVRFCIRKSVCFTLRLTCDRSMTDSMGCQVSICQQSQGKAAVDAGVIRLWQLIVLQAPGGATA